MSDYKNYWDKNIDKWAELYLQISHGHEELDAPSWLGKIYNATIAKHEAALMRERYAITISFIDIYVTSGKTFADIGCGTGIFVVEALKRGAKALAIDFSDRSLEVTKENVAKNAPDADVAYFQLNVENQALPKSDFAIMVGVTPYLAGLEHFLGNVLGSTDLLLIQYTDPSHWANIIRTVFPFLNVRRLVFHSKSSVDANYKKHGWSLLNRRRFATGFVDVVASPSFVADRCKQKAGL